VHIVSKDPQDAPIIAPNYLSTPEDKRVAVESISFNRKIVESGALKPYQPKEYKPGANLNTEEELVEAAGNIGTTIFHPVGTCKMGKDSDPMAVLDSSLNVRGVKGLRLVDASAMPRITSGNTAAPTMMIAYRAADLILSK
jgi:choline dehydrogenase